MALHAAALAYPALFLDSKTVTPVIVTVVEAEGGGGNGSAGEPLALQKKTARAARKAALPEERQDRVVVEPEKHLAEPVPTIAAPLIATDVVGMVAVPGSHSDFVAVASRVREGEAGDTGVNGDNADNSRGSGGGIGSGAGTAQGSGSGTGIGNGSGASSSVKASYAYCPKPDYPESARRKGWEGTVTLRVLVDERGKSKSLEINRSSGFPVPDQAAADNVKLRCRFNPARDGEKQIESWIRIPVVFRLADPKDR